MLQEQKFRIADEIHFGYVYTATNKFFVCVFEYRW